MMLIINWSGVHVLVSQRERERRFGHHGERNKTCLGITQGSKGIRQWPINGCTFPVMIHKITPSVDYN